LLCEAFERWLSGKWCWRHLQHPPLIPPY
jgi:hypothetical protein